MLGTHQIMVIQVSDAQALGFFGPDKKTTVGTQSLHTGKVGGVTGGLETSELMPVLGGGSDLSEAINALGDNFAPCEDQFRSVSSGGHGG